MKEAKSKCLKLEVSRQKNLYRGQLGTYGGQPGETVILDDVCPIEECMYGCKLIVKVDDAGAISSVIDDPIGDCFLRN